MCTLPHKPLSRRDRDVRLGYVGLGIGAVVFVAMAATNFVITGEVLPPIPSVHGPVQSDNTASRQSIQEGAFLVNFSRDEPSQGVPVSAAVAVVGVGTSGNDGAATGASAAELVGAPSGGHPTDPGPGTPDHSGQQGPASGLLDPAVGGAAHGVDGLTGGATSPVTGPATSANDHATDIVDGLLSGSRGPAANSEGRGPQRIRNHGGAARGSQASRRPGEAHHQDKRAHHKDKRPTRSS